MPETFVIGHRNPDTDAICSAIAYADLLRRTGRIPEAIPACCGEISARTAHVLQRGGLENPRLVMDVRVTASSICSRNSVVAHTGEPLHTPYERMRAKGLRSLPVLDDDGRLVGMLSVSKLMDLLIPSNGDISQLRVIESSLDRIGAVLRGQFQHACDTAQEDTLTLTVAALSAPLFNERIRKFPARQVLVVTGDRPTVQETAIAYGVRGIIITGGTSLAPELLAKAQAQGVTVILTNYDTATTTLLIKLAKRITLAMQTQFTRFPENTPLRQMREIAQATMTQTLFPVTRADDTLVGVVSKSDLIAPPPTRLILVDHNELSQAVTGADEAEIVEVLDHHRLGGGLSFPEPIRFVIEPLGSTCTLVARAFRQNGLEPDRPIAFALAGGIVSDTLHLTSPTTTPADREVLAWLEPIMGVSAREFAEGFFAAGSALQVLTPALAVRSDSKVYEENGWRIAVAQVEELGMQLFHKKKDELADALEKMVREDRLDFAALLITDITRHYSLLQVAGHPALRAAVDYPRLETNLFELEGIVSRKKQLLPHLMRLMARTTRE